MDIPVTFRFYGVLNELLPDQYRQIDFILDILCKRSIKDVVEALHVPHVEVALLLVNGESVSWDYILKAGDRVSVYPYLEDESLLLDSKVWQPFDTEKKFVLDVHLGKLAGYLRLLGFDCLYQSPDPGDFELASTAIQEGRILLTCDRQLLMHKELKWGYILRSRDSLIQVEEVIHYFDLQHQVNPYTRCKLCNTLLAEVKNVSLLELPEKVLANNGQEPEAYRQCLRCDKVYWRGTHTQRLDKLIDKWTIS